MEEILNIEYHKRRLLLKALNKAEIIKDAAKLLGINQRRLYMWKKDFNIEYNKERREYFIKESKIKII